MNSGFKISLITVTSSISCPNTSSIEDVNSKRDPSEEVLDPINVSHVELPTLVVIVFLLNQNGPKWS